MASEMAIARTARNLPPSQISKSTRQIVPAFLQKLYEMVNDPKNSDLIRWSEAGDSFYVLDHERFAHNVLPSWFKHKNFSSFVRQLNMYGFHKVPHLQQGVLKSDTETEYWNFAHPNFHRGQPDLLCLIQRKKTAAHSVVDDGLDIRDGQMPTASGSGASSSTHGQVLDVQAIVSGITAIKRHQTTISAELNELKRSNQLLWQDSMEARARYQKQQDTINRIVKFLAGVYGQGTHTKDDSVQSSPSHVVVPRKASRLLLEDARKNIVEMDDLDTLSSIETPISIPAASPTPSDYVTTADPSTPHTSDTTTSQAEPPADLRAMTPTRLNTASPDLGRAYLDSLTPEQMQQLFASLNAHPILDPIPTPSAPQSDPSNSHVMPYTPPAYIPMFNAALQLPTPSEGLISFNPLDTVTPHEPLERNWQAAEDIQKDVDALNTSIHQLIQTFGLDPNLVDGSADPPPVEPLVSTPNSHSRSNSNLPDGGVLNDIGIAAAAAAGAGTMPVDLNLPMPASDFDFDSFFNTLPETTGADGNVVDFTADAASTAFLDEPPSPAGTASGASPMVGLRGLSPDVSTTGMFGAGGGKKRKSDVSELDLGGLARRVTVPSGNEEKGDVPPTVPAKRRKEK